MQPVYLDKGKRPRFRANRIVRALLDFATPRGFGLNELARMKSITRDEREQFAQLIGYSVAGFAELTYVSESVAEQAERAASRAMRRVNQ